jgi:phosphoenolpyruvate carboxylase
MRERVAITAERLEIHNPERIRLFIAKGFSAMAAGYVAATIRRACSSVRWCFDRRVAMVPLCL